MKIIFANLRIKSFKNVLNKVFEIAQSLYLQITSNIKIISLELKSCETTKGEKTNVLEMIYSIGKETGKALLKDYNPKDDKEAKNIIKAFKKSVREANANRK